MIGKENESYEKKNRKGMSCYAQNEILKYMLAMLHRKFYHKNGVLTSEEETSVNPHGRRKEQIAE